MKSLNTGLRDPLQWVMPRLTAKDKTHPSPQPSPFLSNNVHNGVLRCRYCVNNLNSDLDYWAPRSQPHQAPMWSSFTLYTFKRHFRRRGRSGWRWPSSSDDLVCGLIRCSGDICFLRENCNSGTLIHFVMNDWMSMQAMKSPRGERAWDWVCVCNTVRLFHLFGKITLFLQTPAPSVRSSQNEEGFKMARSWLEFLLNVRGGMKQRWSGHYAAES